MCTNNQGLQCGTEIIWDNTIRRYVNTSDHKPHTCANFAPKNTQIAPPATTTLQPPQQIVEQKEDQTPILKPGITISESVTRLGQEPKVETMSMSEMAQAKYDIGVENNKALKLIGEGLKAIAIEMALDRRQRDEFNKELRQKQYNNSNNDNVGLSE